MFFQGQPKTWKQQFEESPNAPKLEDMPLAELKEHFKVKEENSFKSQQRNAKKQKNEAWKKRKATDQGDEKSGCNWKKRKGKDKSNPQKGSDKPKPVEANIPKNAACPVHGNKGNNPHTWGECAMNPENKDHKDLDKFRPKKGKGKGQPKTDANTSETHNVEEVPLAAAKPEVNEAILDGNTQIGKTNAVEPSDSTNSSHLHHLDCIHLQEMVVHVNSVEPTVFRPFWSSSCSPTKLTRKLSSKSSLPIHARSSTNSGSTSMRGTMATPFCSQIWQCH